MVLGNRLMFGSVSSSRSHFDAGIHDMVEIQRRYEDVLKKMITTKLKLPDFRKAFFPKSDKIKTVVYFK
jgi:hypothetical protein